MIQLRDYQISIANQAVQILNKHKCCYLAMECRTGKTLTALEAARKYGAKSVLFITKKSAINDVRKDFETLQKLTPLYSFDVVNHESAKKFIGREYNIVIIDEAHNLGAFPKPTIKTKNIREVCKKTKSVILMSGTPTPEGYSQLYHQFWVCPNSPFKSYKNFYLWAKEFVNIKKKRINGYDINDYSHAYKKRIMEVVADLFINFSQDDADFNTGIKIEKIICPLSTVTSTIIKKMKQDRISDLPDKSIILGETPVKLFQKLHQLSSGTVIDENGISHIIDPSKAIAIRDRFIGKRIAIFYNFKAEKNLLDIAFPNHTDDASLFQNQSGSEIVYLNQIRRAREGVRLDTADAIIFFNLEWSYVSYTQGIQRIMSKERIKEGRVYFMISDCGIDSDILEAVISKNDFTTSWYYKKHNKNQDNDLNIKSLNESVAHNPYEI